MVKHRWKPKREAGCKNQGCGMGVCQGHTCASPSLLTCCIPMVGEVLSMLPLFS